MAARGRGHRGQLGVRRGRGGGGGEGLLSPILLLLLLRLLLIHGSAPHSCSELGTELTQRQSAILTAPLVCSCFDFHFTTSRVSNTGSAVECVFSCSSHQEAAAFTTTAALLCDLQPGSGNGRGGCSALHWLPSLSRPSQPENAQQQKMQEV